MEILTEFDRIYEFEIEKKSSIEAPVTSVVIPAYNAGETIQRAVISALTQETRFPYEVVVVDDGSKIPVKNSLEDVVGDSRISLFREPNKGVSEAMNLGCLLARGRYILRLDADDEILAEAVEKMTDILERNPGVAYAYSDGFWIGPLLGWDWERFSPVDSSKSVNSWEKREFDSKLLLEGMYLGHARIYRRHGFLEVGGFNLQYSNGEDWDFALKMSEMGGVKRLPVKLHKYYFSGNGLTQAMDAEETISNNRRIAMEAISRRNMKFDDIPEGVRKKFDITQEDLKSK